MRYKVLAGEVLAGMVLVGSPLLAAQAQCVPDTGGVTLNEFVANPAGTDGTVLLEWVELHNSGGAAVSLDGWQISKASSADSYSVEATLPVGASIASGGFYVVGEANVSGADHVLSTTLSLGSGLRGDGLRLTDCEGTVVDTVIYGSNNDDAVVDDSGVAGVSLAPTPGSDESIARRRDGVDTDASGDDFWVPSVATRGGANPTPPSCQTSAGDLVINEFLANPAGADGGFEYVELYNAGVTTVALEGWRIEAETSSSWSTKATLPSSAAVGPGEWFLIADPGFLGANVNTVSNMSLPNGSNGDGLRLVDCAGNPVDTVVYGDTNDDGILDDRGMTSGYVGKPGNDQAIARLVDGDDTDVALDDFFLTLDRTPGARNPVAPVCIPTAGNVVINELLSNPSGADGDVLLEWVELYNGGASAVSLDGWSVRVATSENSFSTKITLTSGTVIPPDGYLLVGEANVPATDATVVGNLGMGSGLRGDGVRLVDCRDNVVDTVVYGDSSNEDAVVDDSGVAAISVASTPGDDIALARRQDGQDTDRSGEDFVATSSPTPGAPNPTFECFPSTGDVLLNEALVDPAGSDGEVMREWVELYNRSGDPLRLDGWQLGFASNQDDLGPDFLFPPEAEVPALGFYVVGAANVDAADVVTALSIGNGSGGDAIRLIDCEGSLVDLVVYGDPNEDGLLDESGGVARSVTGLGSDMSVARAEDGVDTDDADDWVVDRSPSPGATNVTIYTDTGDTDAVRGCGRRATPDGAAPQGGCGSERAPNAETGCATGAFPLGGLEVLVAGLFGLVRRRRSRAA